MLNSTINVLTTEAILSFDLCDIQGKLSFSGCQKRIKSIGIVPSRTVVDKLCLSST